MSLITLTLASNILSSAEKRKQSLQQRRLTREEKIEGSIHIWEEYILPNWKVVHKRPSLRKLWWSGIPTTLRATMWENAVGNALALSKGRDPNIGVLPLNYIVLVGSNQITTEHVLPEQSVLCRPAPFLQQRLMILSKISKARCHVSTYFIRNQVPCTKTSRICYVHGSCRDLMKVWDIHPASHGSQPCF